MLSVNMSEARARLSELVERAAAGETIEILRRGTAVARLGPVRPARKPVNVEALRRLTGRMSNQKPSAGDFMREMRDSDRY